MLQICFRICSDFLECTVSIIHFPFTFMSLEIICLELNCGMELNDEESICLELNWGMELNDEESICL